MSWVYNRGLVFVYEDAHRWWPLRGVVRSIKRICAELWIYTEDIRRKDFRSLRLTSLSFGGLFLARRTHVRSDLSHHGA